MKILAALLLDTSRHEYKRTGLYGRDCIVKLSLGHKPYTCELTRTQYVVNTLNTTQIRHWNGAHLDCYFLVAHTHVLCMGSGSAVGLHASGEIGVFVLPDASFLFQAVILTLKIYTTEYSTLSLIILIISLNCLQHIQKRRNFESKSDMSLVLFVYCYMPYRKCE